jgi:type II secretory pathway pseudopilin PulG
VTAGKFRRRRIWGIVLVCLPRVVALAIFVSSLGPIVDTKEAQARQDLQFLRQALHALRENYGRYPTTEESLNILADPSQKERYVVSRLGIEDPWRHTLSIDHRRLRRQTI